MQIDLGDVVRMSMIEESMISPVQPGNIQTGIVAIFDAQFWVTWPVPMSKWSYFIQAKLLLPLLSHWPFCGSKAWQVVPCKADIFSVMNTKCLSLQPISIRLTKCSCKHWTIICLSNFTVDHFSKQFVMTTIWTCFLSFSFIYLIPCPLHCPPPPKLPPPPPPALSSFSSQQELMERG